MKHEHTTEQQPEQIIKRKQYEKFITTKPPKPINGYFKFRQQKISELQGTNNLSLKIKIAWDQLSEGTKEEMNKQYKRELEEHQQKMLIWKQQLEKYGPSIHRQKPNRSASIISYHKNEETNQQTDCWNCNKLWKQKATLQQQIIQLQKSLSNMENKLILQSGQTQKYKSSYEKLRQRLKKEDNQ